MRGERGAGERTSFWSYEITHLRGGWVAVYLLNLGFPLYMGLEMTRDGATIGIFCGIPILLALGYWVCVASPWFGTTLTMGGGVVALSQLLPVIQIMVGMLGVEAARRAGYPMMVGMGDGRSPHIRDLPGGLLATLVTGGILMIAAFFAGLMLRGVIRSVSSSIADRPL